MQDHAITIVLEAPSADDACDALTEITEQSRFADHVQSIAPTTGDLTDRERRIIVEMCGVVIAADPIIRDLLEPSAQLSASDLADIRALRDKIGATL